MLIAVTRPVSPSLAQCELTHLARQPIDAARAAAQHGAYEQLLASLGATLVSVPAAPELPDAVFVEDTALVLDELAVLTRPGAASRRAELPGVAAVLARYRRMLELQPPATLDGGDVLRVGRILYVGRSERTNQQGIDQLASLLNPFDYEVRAVAFRDCLHLKSAVTDVAERLLLFNPAWIDPAAFPGCDLLTVAPEEPYGANALRIAGAVVYSAQYPRTRDRLVARGLQVAAIDCSELAKAEGAVTCCSLLFEAAGV